VWTDGQKHLLNSLIFRTTWVIQHQKGWSSLDFNEAGDDGVTLASAGPYTNHLHLTPDRLPQQHLISHFLRGRMFFLTPIQQYVKAQKAYAVWCRPVHKGKYLVQMWGAFEYCPRDRVTDSRCCDWWKPHFAKRVPGKRWKLEECQEL